VFEPLGIGFWGIFLLNGFGIVFGIGFSLIFSY